MADTPRKNTLHYTDLPQGTPIARITDGSKTADLHYYDGDPNSTITADKGSFCFDLSGSAPWYKSTDAVATGWVRSGDGKSLAHNRITATQNIPPTLSELQAVGFTGASFSELSDTSLVIQTLSDNSQEFWSWSGSWSRVAYQEAPAADAVRDPDTVTFVGHGLPVADEGEMTPKACSFNKATGSIQWTDTNIQNTAPFNAYVVGVVDSSTVLVRLSGDAEDMGLRTLVNSPGFAPGHTYFLDENGDHSLTPSLVVLWQAYETQKFFFRPRVFMPNNGGGGPNIVERPPVTVDFSFHGLPINGEGEMTPRAASWDRTTGAIGFSTLGNQDTHPFNAYIVSVLNQNQVGVRLSGDAEDMGLRSFTHTPNFAGSHVYYLDANGLHSFAQSPIRLWQAYDSDSIFFRPRVFVGGTTGGGNTVPDPTDVEDYRHDQTTVDATWIISHNKGQEPESVSFRIGDQPAETKWENYDVNQVRAYFSIPQSGVAILEFEDIS